MRAPSMRVFRRIGAIRDSPTHGHAESEKEMVVEVVPGKQGKARDISKAESTLKRLKSRMGLGGGEDKEGSYLRKMRVLDYFGNLQQ